MIQKLPRKLTILALAGATVFATAACADDGGDQAAPAGSADGEKPTIVTSTSVWGDVASAVAGDDATVTPIITGDGIDPHHFEPSAGDMAKVSEADYVVVGGGGYDAWLYGSIEDDSKVVHALPLTPHHHPKPEEIEASGEEPQNEHVWYSTEYVGKVAEDLAAKLDTQVPDSLKEKLDNLHERIGGLPEIRVGQVEPIGDYIVQESPMTDATPKGFRNATLAEAEPSAADLAAFLEAINNDEIDLLIYNPQTSTDATDRIRKAAEDKNIPVVEISETPPIDVNFLDTFDGAVSRLEEASQGLSHDNHEDHDAHQDAAA